jgi:hypothetical protein
MSQRKGIAMNTVNEIKDTARVQRRVFPKRMLPIAAGLALALASAVAHAQTTPSVGCATQQAGEGEGQYSRQQAAAGGSTAQPQKAGEGEGQYSRQQAGAAIPCKG